VRVHHLLRWTQIVRPEQESKAVDDSDGKVGVAGKSRFGTEETLLKLIQQLEIEIWLDLNIFSGSRFSMT
jgi:hypothetical protein